MNPTFIRQSTAYSPIGFLTFVNGSKARSPHCTPQLYQPRLDHRRISLKSWCVLTPSPSFLINFRPFQKSPKMGNWPAVLNRAKESLDSILLEGGRPAPIDSSQDPMQRLFSSIVQYTKRNKGHKWLSNFEVAAMHLGVHLNVYLSIMGLNLTENLAI